MLSIVNLQSFIKLKSPNLPSIPQCCNCSGKCGDGSFLLYAYPGVSPNYYDCLDKCLAYIDPNNPLVECGFFTHDVALEKCYLYSNCPELDVSCLTCTTGKFETLQ